MAPKTPKKLTPKEELFVAEYLISLNASDAYRRAGYKGKNANVEGHRILTKPYIQSAIGKAQAERFERIKLNGDDLLRRAETVLMADARKLTSHHIGSCRYCWGVEHHYQWKTEREWLAEDPEKEPNGGFGYRITNKPHPDCPECSGLGEPYTVFADTDDLPEDVAVLFEGVKETRHGKEIVMASKQAAFDTLAKHHNLLITKHELTGKDGKPISHDMKVTAKVVMVPPKDESVVEVKKIPKGEGE